MKTKNKRTLILLNLAFIAIVATTLVTAARAQSTDMDTPTALITNVITGEGDGKGELLYYSFTATAGDVKVTLDAKTDKYSTPVEVTLLTEDGKELLQVTVVAGDKMERKAATKHFVREEKVILRISTREDKEVKLLTYKIKLDGSVKIDAATTPSTEPVATPVLADQTPATPTSDATPAIPVADATPVTATPSAATPGEKAPAGLKEKLKDKLKKKAKESAKKVLDGA